MKLILIMAWRGKWGSCVYPRLLLIVLLAGCCWKSSYGVHKKYVPHWNQLDSFSRHIRDRDPSYVGLTEMEHKSEFVYCTYCSRPAPQLGRVACTPQPPMDHSSFKLKHVYLTACRYYFFFLLYKEQFEEARQLRLGIHVIQPAV